MNQRRILQISSLILIAVGAFYLGRAAARGLDNKYGYVLLGIGVAIGILTALFGKKGNKNN